jgi:nucleoid DNA-binding protein
VNHYGPLIRDYLLQYKLLSLEKIGTLTIDEKTSSAHPLSLQFQYDKKASTSAELINYIAERTGKTKVLIQSDIESYTETMRQLINIGKSYVIEGIGEYKLAQSGEYEFSVYETPSGKEEHKTVRRQPSGELMKKGSSNRNALMIVSLIIVLGILGVIGWGTYNFFTTNIKDHSVSDSGVVATAPPVNDTASFVASDSITSIKDTSKNNTAMVIKTDTADYKFVYETTLLAERATRRTKQLRNFGEPAEFDSIATDAGQLYRLYIKKRLANADTTRKKDSLERYLQRSIQIVPVN